MKTTIFSIIWAVCFFFVLMPVKGLESEFFLAAFLTMIAGQIYAVASLPRAQDLTIPKSGFLLCAFGFWVLAFISVLASAAPLSSTTYFAFFSMMPLGFMLCLMAPDRDTFFKQAGCIAAIAFAGISLFSVLQYSVFGSYLANGLTHWPMANPNSLAGLLSLGIFGAFGYAQATDQPKHRWVSIALALLIFAGMLTTASRGAFLSLVLLVVLFWGAKAWLEKKPGVSLFASLFSCLRIHHVALVIAPVLVFVGLSFLAHESAYQTPIYTMLVSLNGQASLMGERFSLWASAWGIIQQHFWLGTGIGTFFLYYPEFKTEIGTAGRMAHNDVLQFFSEMGVFAPLLFYAVIGFACVKTWQVLKALKSNQTRELVLILAPFCALAAMILHTHITFHFNILAMLFFAGTVLAFWFHSVEKEQPSNVFVLSKAKDLGVFKASLIALLVCGTVFVTCFQMSQILLDRAKQSFEQGDRAGFERLISWAVPLSLEMNGRALGFASSLPTSKLYVRNSALPISEQYTLFDEADRMLNNAIRVNPRVPNAYYELAVLHVYARKNFPPDHQRSPQDIEALLSTAVRIDPQFPSARQKLAEHWVSEGKQRQAYDLLIDGMSWRYKKNQALPMLELMERLAGHLGDQKRLSQIRARLEDLRENRAQK